MIFAFHLHVGAGIMRKHPLLNTALNSSRGLGNIPSLITSITFLFVEYEIEYFAGTPHTSLKFLLLGDVGSLWR